MVDHLIELVFKEITIDKIGPLLLYLISDERAILSYNITIEIPSIEWDAKKINKIFFDNKFFGLFVNLKELKAGSIDMPNCGLAVYKYENNVDLEINFQLSALKKAPIESLGENLMKFAKKIASQYQINQYLCGIEPAHDLRTRLFTNGTLGPFFFRSKRHEV